MSITFDSSRHAVTKASSRSNKASRSTSTQGERTPNMYAAQRLAMMNVVRDSESLTYSRLGAFQTAHTRGRHVEAIG
jgi:hypothetical protein